MFIVESNPNQEMKILLRAIKQKLGKVPPHWELFATINPTRFKMFLEEIQYLSSHPHIISDFFAMLRYVVACDNGFEYCIKFNHTYLLSKGYTQKQLDALTGNQKIVPLDSKYKALFVAVMQALYQPDDFTVEVIEGLKSLEWTDADILDAVDHGAFLFKFSKILKAYSKVN